MLTHCAPLVLLCNSITFLFFHEFHIVFTRLKSTVGAKIIQISDIHQQRRKKIDAYCSRRLHLYNTSFENYIGNLL